jgi:hypothetical protein
MRVMSKIKLPRKRKKEYIKQKSRGDYYMTRILSEILVEEERKFGDRFYELRVPRKNDSKTNNRYPYNGYVIVKRW